MNAVQHDDADRANCRALRSRGCRHARTLRSAVGRLLGVVCRMLDTGQNFDPERRSKNSACPPKKALDVALRVLPGEECTLRETGRTEIALRTAKLFPVKTLEGFDFAFQPLIDREWTAALAQFDFIRRNEAAASSARREPGKTASRRRSALQPPGREKRCRTTLAEPADSLAEAERQGRLAEKIRFLAWASLPVVDEIGYLPAARGGANLFFRIVDASCEKGVMIPRRTEASPNRATSSGAPVVATALLDRLLLAPPSSGLKAQAAG